MNLCNEGVNEGIQNYGSYSFAVGKFKRFSEDILKELTMLKKEQTRYEKAGSNSDRIKNNITALRNLQHLCLLTRNLIENEPCAAELIVWVPEEQYLLAVELASRPSSAAGFFAYFEREEDCRKVFALCEKAVKHGSASEPWYQEALTGLAEICFYVFCKRGDLYLEEARSCFEIFNQEQNRESNAAVQVCLGHMYDKGVAVEQDHGKAAEYYMKAYMKTWNLGYDYTVSETATSRLEKLENRGFFRDANIRLLKIIEEPLLDDNDLKKCFYFLFAMQKKGSKSGAL